jgi:indole-3-glycerol phosphate synthase
VSILERILLDKRREVDERRARTPLAELQGRVQEAPPPRGFREALVARPAGGPAFRVVAEVKRASPSKGVIRADFDPVAIARGYERGGAAAISVLTDAKYFQGSLEDLLAVRQAVRLPVLRKDFIVDRYQVWEARAAGADAILLIVAATEATAAQVELAREAEGLGMDVLWEVHDRSELERLLAHAPRLVGINNRDLKSFEVSLETTRRLLPAIPAGAVSVSESGFSRRAELEMLSAWGVGAFLIGEMLMRAPDPGAALLELVGAHGEESTA